MKKMTRWFGGDTAPVHVGWYPVKAQPGGLFVENCKNSVVKRTTRYWDGMRWMWMTTSGRMAIAAFAYKDQWRGFTKEQK